MSQTSKKVLLEVLYGGALHSGLDRKVASQKVNFVDGKRKNKPKNFLGQTISQTLTQIFKASKKLPHYNTLSLYLICSSSSLS